jgi:TRAP-type C4-dicarboxylate transport system permease small subunit
MVDFRVPGQWIKYCAFLAISGLFLVFGIHLLAASYRLNDPFSFVMTFFASNLMILISAVGVIAFVIRMVQLYRGEEKE